MRLLFWNFSFMLLINPPNVLNVMLFYGQRFHQPVQDSCSAKRAELYMNYKVLNWRDSGTRGLLLQLNLYILLSEFAVEEASHLWSSAGWTNRYELLKCSGSSSSHGLQYVAVGHLVEKKQMCINCTLNHQSS